MQPRSRILRPAPQIVAAAFLLAAAVFAGCGDGARAQTAGDKVIAHVGSVNVTESDVDDELTRAKVPADKRSDQVLKDVLSRVATRKYLAQRALEGKLDRIRLSAALCFA